MQSDIYNANTNKRKLELLTSDRIDVRVQNIIRDMRYSWC